MPAYTKISWFLSFLRYNFYIYFITKIIRMTELKWTYNIEKIKDKPQMNRRSFIWWGLASIAGVLLASCVDEVDPKPKTEIVKPADPIYIPTEPEKVIAMGEDVGTIDIDKFTVEKDWVKKDVIEFKSIEFSIEWVRKGLLEKINSDIITKAKIINWKSVDAYGSPALQFGSREDFRSYILADKAWSSAVSYYSSYNFSDQVAQWNSFGTNKPSAQLFDKIMFAANGTTLTLSDIREYMWDTQFNKLFDSYPVKINGESVKKYVWKDGDSFKWWENLEIGSTISLSASLTWTKQPSIEIKLIISSNRGRVEIN